MNCQYFSNATWILSILSFWNDHMTFDASLDWGLNFHKEVTLTRTDEKYVRAFGMGKVVS
jgi:hypothetical protein